jgi:hypothetical protein
LSASARLKAALHAVKAQDCVTAWIVVGGDAWRELIDEYNEHAKQYPSMPKLLVDYTGPLWLYGLSVKVDGSLTGETILIRCEGRDHR